MKEKKTKLLAGFFIGMIIFTFLSRATDAITVGKVRAEGLKQDVLLFKISGTAVVKEKKQKKVKPKEGYIIKEVKVKKGEKIKEGQLLYTYDLEKIEEEKRKLEGELKKLELSYEKEKLGISETKEKIDLESLLLAEKYAEKSLKAAKRKTAHIKETVREEKEKERQELKDKRDSMAEDKNTVKVQMETALRTAEREIKDKELKLQQIKKPLEQVNKLLSHYEEGILEKDYTKIETAKYHIFNYFYDKKYDTHRKEVEQAQIKYKRAIEDRDDMEEKWKEIIKSSDKDDEDEAVREKYYENVRMRREERKEADRAIEDARKETDLLEKKDKELSEMLTQYRYYLEQASSAASEEKKLLFDYLCKDKIKEDLEEDIKEAETALERAKEDKINLEENGKEELERNNKKIEKLEEEIAKIEKELKKIENNQYNYKLDLEETKELIREKQRALEEVRLQIKNAGDTQLNQAEQQAKSEKANQLELKSILVDIDEKKKEIQEAEEVLIKEGRVSSPMDGKVLLITFEKGSIINSQDELLLSVKGFELKAETIKDELKYFDMGDKITVKLGEKEEKSVTIAEIKKAGRDDKQIFIMDVPKSWKNIKAGESFEYSGEKQSADYSQCISIGALREDEKGTYLLIIQTRESILGNEQITVRRNAIILEKDNEKAALKADVSEEDKIVVESNKNISIGDRVRLEETESE